MTREDQPSIDFAGWVHQTIRKQDFTGQFKASDVLEKSCCYTLMDDVIGKDPVRRQVARQAIAKMYELAGIDEEMREAENNFWRGI
jgi:PIN domain nuclease of toxin-antitoxin system